MKEQEKIKHPKLTSIDFSNDNHPTELLKRSIKWLERLENRKEYIKNGFFDVDTDVVPLIKDIRKHLKEQE